MLPAGAVAREPPPAEREAVEPGGRFGPLAFTGDDIEIGELLGTGAQAHVYRCTRVRAGDGLAVKVVDLRRLRMQAENPQESIRRLENEVRLLREVEHERCLGLFDIFRTKKHLFLVMECMEGGELFDQIIKKKHFNEVEARHVFRQVVEGLVSLHSKHIVHRDLKPENVLIASSREAPPPDSGTLYEIKIVDFGMSKLKEDGLELQSMVGTPQYWAPEVFDQGAYDERVDLWSAGVLLYVMLCGRYPFKGECPMEQIRSGRYDLSSRNWPQVSEEAKDVVRSLIQVDPAQRLSLHRLLQHPWLVGPREAAVPTVPAEPRQPQMLPVVLARRDCAEHNVGGGHAFDLRELLRQQLALAASLERACLACRHSHPRLSASIRQALCQAHHLSQQALDIVGRYASTARNVRERLLPDLQLAIQEAEPSLAADLLEVARGWVQGMREDGQEVHRLCQELSQQLSGLAAHARQDRTLEDGWQELPPLQAALPLPASAVQLPKLLACPRPDASEGEPRRGAQALIQGLVAFVDRLAESDACGAPGGPEACRRDLVDLLFMAPGGGLVLDPEPGAQAAQPPPGAVELPAAAGASAAAGSGAAAALARAHPLLRGLQELRRVAEILQGCEHFWTELDSTIQELSRLREQTSALLRYTARSAALRARFDERLAEYSAFWGSLADLCESYCAAMRPALQRSRQFVSEVEGAADAVDAVRRFALPA